MKRVVFFAITLLLVSSLASFAFAFETYSSKNGFVAYSPDKINVFEPFSVQVFWNANNDYNKTQEEYFEDDVFISLTGCSVNLERDSTLHRDNDDRFVYSKEEEFLLSLTNFEEGSIDGINDDHDGETLNYCRISFENKDGNEFDSVSIPFKQYTFDYGLAALPEGVKDDSIQNYRLLKQYKGGNEEYWEIDFRLISDYDYKLNRKLSRDELADKNYLYDNHISSSSADLEFLDFGGQPGIFEDDCKQNDYFENEEDIEYQCSFRAFVYQPFGIIKIEIDVNNYDHPVSDYAAYGKLVEKWDKDALDTLSSIYFDSTGSTTTIEVDFEGGSTDSNNGCGECKENYVCGICNKCIKKKNAYDIDDLEVSGTLHVSKTDSSLKSKVDEISVYRAEPELSFENEDGDEVDFCDVVGNPKIKIAGELISEVMYSGFTSGRISDKREDYFDYDVKLEEDKKYPFIVAPSSESKPVISKENYKSEYKFTLEYDDIILDSVDEELTLTPIDFDIKLKSKSSQVQQGSTGVLEITPSGASTPNTVVRVSLIGPGHIGKKHSKNINSFSVLEILEKGEKLKVAYKAPAMGSFDIGSELQSLSMVELQKKAAAQIAEDAFMAYAGDYVGGIDELVQAGEYAEKMGHLTEAFKLANGAKTLRGLADGGISGLEGEMGDAMGVNDGKKEAGFWEKTADAGIVGISIAQTTVGIVTFIPNKIPGVGKLTAGVQTAFSAATNIWKANLKYISKSAKIERAREIYYPVVLIVTAREGSGWVVQKMHTFNIVYHKVD